jgi:hypothetical protein
VIARRSRTLAVLGLVGRAVRITTVVAAGCGEIADASLLPDVAPMTVERGSESILVPPIEEQLRV